MEKKSTMKLMVGINSIILYLILFISKNFVFSFLNLNGFSENLSLIVDIEYQVLIVLLGTIYYVSNKDNKKYMDTFIQLLIGFLSIALYFLLTSIETSILNLIGVTSNSSQIIKSISLILYSVILMAILIIINLNSLKKDIKDIKKNHRSYFSKYIKYWFFATLIMMFSNLIINFLNNGAIAGNEESVRSIFKAAPIYTLFSAVVFAPIVEELVFRRSLKNIISSPIFFIITSGLVFGGLHVVGNINSWIDILYIIPYSVHGVTFAYILTKTDNVLISMGLHFLHNGIMMSLEVLLFLLGVL